jgi:hypothetical protein
MARILAVFLVLSFFAAVPARAATLSIPAVEGAPGQSVEVPVMVSAVDNLAGIKVKLTYDKTLLTYKTFTKSRWTNNLIHVVNDKNPGVLIVVMAAARGIQGVNFPVGTVGFVVSATAKPGAEAAFQISEVQLMSDQLKELDWDAETKPLKVVKTAPAAAEKTGQTPPAEGPVKTGKGKK